MSDSHASTGRGDWQPRDRGREVEPPRYNGQFRPGGPPGGASWGQPRQLGSGSGNRPSFQLRGGYNRNFPPLPQSTGRGQFVNNRFAAPRPLPGRPAQGNMGRPPFRPSCWVCGRYGCHSRWHERDEPQQSQPSGSQSDGGSADESRGNGQRGPRQVDRTPPNESVTRPFPAQ